MKTKRIKFTVIPAAAAVILILCYGIYYLTDVVWNGSFVDWFMTNYMHTYESFSPETEGYVIITEPVWPNLKLFAFAVFFLVVFICAAVTLCVSRFYAKSRVKKTITTASGLMRRFMDHDSDAAGIFPKEYAEIAVQMAEIKASMQRHEQHLKDEATRKNDLITYLAHDLKTPLTSIVGYLSLLDEIPDMPAAQSAKYIGVTLDKAHRLEQLINEFFEITRYNLQQIDLEKETIDLSYMLIQMADEFYPLLTAHGNTIELQADENLSLYGDALKLARVFNNILKNAIAYSYPDTIIEIWAEDTGGSVSVYFRNRGKTIPAAKLNSIFEKFFRLDEARNTNTGGAGLGLAIAKEIVSLHGGTITAESEKETTVFCVSLPTLQ